MELVMSIKTYTLTVMHRDFVALLYPKLRLQSDSICVRGEGDKRREKKRRNTCTATGYIRSTVCSIERGTFNAPSPLPFPPLRSG